MRLQPVLTRTQRAKVDNQLAIFIPKKVARLDIRSVYAVVSDHFRWTLSSDGHEDLDRFVSVVLSSLELVFCTLLLGIRRHSLQLCSLSFSHSFSFFLSHIHSLLKTQMKRTRLYPYIRTSLQTVGSESQSGNTEVISSKIRRVFVSVFRRVSRLDIDIDSDLVSVVCV